jgi:carbon-monoxide dehydrogenase large subunit
MDTKHGATQTDGGIGARVQRKEDHRHMHGQGRFVADLVIPGTQEVAFLRSPLAHARIAAIHKPDACAGQVIVREDMPDALDIEPECTLPGYKPSAQSPLASGKVRFAGEPVAMAFAASRAEAEDIIETIGLDLDELPPIPNAAAARGNTDVRVHEHWNDNLFVSIDIDRDFDRHAANAPVVIRKTVDLARQCMTPMEGKAVLAYWDHQFEQLIVYSATQVPHLIRTGLSTYLGIDQGMIRVISPDVGGAFGYKCVMHPEELCIAWLALHYRKPFRYVEDRREHLIAGANSRQHHYELTAYADRAGRLLALDAHITICRGHMISTATAAAPNASPPTSPASCLTAAWRAPASASPSNW